MLKLNVGFNRKAGEANYGSRGASVNLELELDSGLVADPERLKERIRFLFGLAKASVEEELNRHAVAAAGQHGSPAESNGNGHARRQDSTRRATASQVRALRAIADRHQLDLASVLADRLAIRDPAELSITEASQLIDELKSAANGNGTGGRA